MALCRKLLFMRHLTSDEPTKPTTCKIVGMFVDDPSLYRQFAFPATVFFDSASATRLSINFRFSRQTDWQWQCAYCCSCWMDQNVWLCSATKSRCYNIPPWHQGPTLIPLHSLGAPNEQVDRNTPSTVSITPVYTGSGGEIVDVVSVGRARHRLSECELF